MARVIVGMAATLSCAVCGSEAATNSFPKPPEWLRYVSLALTAEQPGS
jgi:hypothetical protein